MRREQDLLRELLRRERTRVGMTAKELSLRLQADPTYVSRVERGYRTVDVVEFLDIAAAIGCDPAELIRELVAGANRTG